jgi:hypothetical protein
LRGGVWIDAYNKITNNVAGTIKARIDANNLYFVTELNEIESTTSDKARLHRSAAGRDI